MVKFNQVNIMVAIVREATGRAEEMGGFLVTERAREREKESKAQSKGGRREIRGRTAREGRECVV